MHAIVCFGLALLLGLAVGCPDVQAQIQPGKTGLDLTIWVENRAQVPPMMLPAAMKSAAKIFQKAGIEVSWQEVLTPDSRPEPGSGNTRLLRISRSEDFGYAEPSLGFRWQRGPEDVRAIVFFDRVEQLARRSSAHLETAPVLGCAIAHEIGHLLLGSGHSLEGVMRAEWKKRDVQSAAQGGLDFTRKESKLMRDELSRRAHASSAHGQR